MRGQLLCFLATGLLLGADAAPEARKECEKLKGNWQIVSVIDPSGKEKAMTAKAEFTLDTLIIDGKVAGTYSVDPAKDPKEMDFVPSTGPLRGKTKKAIYVLEGDTLKMCGAEEGPRPKEFKPDAQKFISLVIFKRQK